MISRKLLVAGVASGALILPVVVAAPALADGNDVLVSGTVTTPSGAPDSGASVYLVAEPTTQALASMAIGQIVSDDVVAEATASHTGAYAFNDPASLPASAATDGIVNYQVLSSGQGGGAFAFSDEAPSAAANRTFSRAAHGLWAPASAAHRANIHEHASTTRRTVAPLDDSSPDRGGGCATEYVKDYGNQSTTVARAYSTSSNASIEVDYTAGASSQLGVGVSASAGGAFSASGTRTVEVDSSDESTMPSDDHQFADAFNTDFDYREYDHFCNGDGHVTQTYEAEAVQHTGGARIAGLSTTPAAPPTSTNCNYYGKGGKEHVSNKTATTFSGGVNISKWIGVSLSAQTGYTSELNATMIAKYGGMNICGTSGPPANPGTFFGK